MNDRSNENLVAACRQGDKAAYAPLVERHYRSVFAMCLGMVSNIHDAEDIAQDVMVKGFQRIAKLSDGSLFVPWIQQIAKNLCIDFLRRQSRQKRRGPTVAEEPATQPRTTDDNHTLYQAIGQLPYELRLPLVMYYFDGKNAKAVAEELGISHSGACQRIRTARRRLHELLTSRVRNE